MYRYIRVAVWNKAVLFSLVEWLLLRCWRARVVGECCGFYKFGRPFSFLYGHLCLTLTCWTFGPNLGLPNEALRGDMGTICPDHDNPHTCRWPRTLCILWYSVGAQANSASIAWNITGVRYEELCNQTNRGVRNLRRASLCAAGYKQPGVVQHCETMVPYARHGVEEHHGYVDQPGIEQYWMIVPNQMRSNAEIDTQYIYGGCVNKPRKGQGELICLGLRNLGRFDWNTRYLTHTNRVQLTIKNLSPPPAPQFIL